MNIINGDTFIVDENYKRLVIENLGLFKLFSDEFLPYECKKRVFYPENEFQLDTGKIMIRFLDEFNFYISCIFSDEGRIKIESRLDNFLEYNLIVDIIKFIIDKRLQGIKPSKEEILDYGLKNNTYLSKNQLLAKLFLHFNLTTTFKRFELMDDIDSYKEEVNEKSFDDSINDIAELWRPSKIDIKTEEQLKDFSDFVDELHNLLRSELKIKKNKYGKRI